MKESNIESFLKVFGLNLVQDEIYDSNNQKVGELVNNNSNISINFIKNNKEITANYNTENNVIDFNDNENNLNGSMYFSNLNDEMVIVKLKYLKDNKVYEMMVKPYGKIFSLDLVNDKKHEVFEINPDGSNDIRNHNYHFIDANILHYSEYGKYNKSDDTYNYEEITRTRVINDTCRVEKITKNNDNISNHIVYAPKKENYVIQSGFLMQSMDPEIYNEISKLRNSLDKYGFGMFDKLIKSSLNKYNNYDLYSLLGINIDNENYVLTDEINNAFLEDKKETVRKMKRRL